MVKPITKSMVNALMQNMRKEAKKKHKDLLEALQAQVEIPNVPQMDIKRTKRIRLNLQWDNGNLLQTDDYGIAAAHVSLRANTLVVYLAQRGELTLPDTQGNIVHITKETLPKYTNENKNWVRIYSNPANEWDGSYTIEEAAKLFHTSAQALKRRLTFCKGTHRKYYVEHGDITIKRFDLDTPMEYVLSIKGNGKIGRYR